MTITAAERASLEHAANELLAQAKPRKKHVTVPPRVSARFDIGGNQALGYPFLRSNIPAPERKTRTPMPELTASDRREAAAWCARFDASARAMQVDPQRNAEHAAWLVVWRKVQKKKQGKRKPGRPPP